MAYAQIQFGSHPRLRGGSKYNHTKKYHHRPRMPIPHALGRPDTTWKNYDRERTKKEHQMAAKKCSIRIKNVPHFGPKVAPILEQKWGTFRTKSWPHCGSKVGPILDQKCALFWAKSVPFFGPKVCPFLDQKCDLNLTEKVHR